MFASDSQLSDLELIDIAIKQLHSIYGATDLKECVSCKMRLQVGKFLALTRSDLVPSVYTRWCKEEGFDESLCQTKFGYPSVEYGALGLEFTKMVQLVNPEGLDGDLYCYYHDQDCHVMPELPSIRMAKLWPPRPKLYEAPKPQGETFNVLHLSDISLQLDYTLLAESNCSQALCCAPRSSNKVHPPPDYDYSSIYDPQFGLSFYDSSYASGHFQKGPYVDQFKTFTPTWLPSHEFGAYGCDTSELMLNNTLQIIRDFHENHLNFEFGIFTGGMVDHADSIHVSRKDVLDSQFRGYRDMLHYLENFPIYSAMGTRDSFPPNQLPTKSLTTQFNYQWQFDFISDLWHESKWIDLDAAKQVRYNQVGYSIITKRGLKIISLNSNVWNTENLYSFIDTLNFDPFGIWQFLIDELIESEINEQRVWIIAHLPPSKHSLPVPTKIFTKIIERFSPKVIAAIFFGYNGKDQFNLIYGGDGQVKDLSNLINYALIGPSVSPLNGNNPAWRYYSVDTETFDVVNSFTYITKLNNTFVNEGAEPVWEYQYSAREAYDPESLWPMERPLDMEFWHHAGEKIRDIPHINKMFNSFEYRQSPYDPYYYLNFQVTEPTTDELILQNDNYCKVTSFSVLNRKECMLTDDQDAYKEPRYLRTFIPLIRPNQSPEYLLLSGPPSTKETESIVYQQRQNPNFDQEEAKQSDVKAKHNRRKSLRDKLHKAHQRVKSEMRKRSFGMELDDV
ncbi:hypothetical protein CANTEDRAFT_107934 [Yamadazyma tenuis ATCC 10573]|uniref:Calcineurin-like phosphoesterase domain-containing protein n=2 Tax=Candida tenuis TaxID=2315449 RepID=G3B917_CANTC|nr:uncharacterized protein CANTEDRAFT_107934 [Yamadazyma tenuis ATCC 10573]EGV62437.1 hypothetical protein CANTEDRAFT_107934 [Yamadazyma tenuis ATCC 10573]